MAFVLVATCFLSCNLQWSPILRHVPCHPILGEPVALHLPAQVEVHQSQHHDSSNTVPHSSHPSSLLLQEHVTSYPVACRFSNIQRKPKTRGTMIYELVLSQITQSTPHPVHPRQTPAPHSLLRLQITYH